MPEFPTRRACAPLDARRAFAMALVLGACLVSAESRAADEPSPKAITAVAISPASVALDGAESQQRLIVHAERSGGQRIDLTGGAKFRSQNEKVAKVGADGIVYPVGTGKTELVVSAAGFDKTVPVEVVGYGRPRPLHFEHDILPVLTRFSCNTSACHGKAEGQNGFKLSVFASDPLADFEALTMEGRGRRVSLAIPDRSMLLTKPAGEVAHAGGLRIPRGTPGFATLRAWIMAGTPLGAADAPKLVGVTLDPREGLLDLQGRQQLRVTARYEDGRQTDVTHLARFQTNDEALAAVDANGLITAGTVPGQVAVMASFMGFVDVFRALIPRTEVIANYPEQPAFNFIDPLTDARLRKLNIVPSPVADDAEYLRRVYVDVIGTLPTAAEARAFLADKRPDRRAKLVDDLLQRPEFADFWALQWADLLKVERSSLGHKGAYGFYRWIRESIARGKPLDEFVRQIVTAEGPLDETPAANFYKADKQPGQWASNASQVFLGMRITCAECHHHPYDRWSQTDYWGMQAFFAPLRLKPSQRGEVLESAGDPITKHPRSLLPVYAHALGEAMPEANPAGDRRAVLAAWMTDAKNPWFARNLANRLWAHFLGRGLVEPVDDVRETNPPSNPELLDALAKHLVESRFDLRSTIRAITASRTYQLSSRPNATNERDEQNYSRALFKRMSAEVLLDAVCQTTGVPEKFAGMPEGYRAVQLWDNQVRHYFLKIFGRPQRTTVCECERATDASVGQVLHLMNSPEIQAKLSHAGGTVARLVAAHPDNSQLVEELYLTCYARYPSAAERQAGVEHLANAAQGRQQAAEDLAWSMLNTIEFIFNH